MDGQILQNSAALRQLTPRNFIVSWRRHKIEAFSASMTICAGNSPVTGEFPAQRPVRRSFGVFFDLRLNKRLNTQWWGWRFETPSHPLWSHCNAIVPLLKNKVIGLTKWYTLHHFFLMVSRICIEAPPPPPPPYVSQFRKYAWQWCDNGLDGVSNHQPYDCLLNRLFRCKSQQRQSPTSHFMGPSMNRNWYPQCERFYMGRRGS